MGNLDKLFHPFIATDAKKNWTSFSSPRMEYFGEDIPGVKFYTGFLVAVKEGYMDIPHIHDGADNFFVLTGASLDNIFDAEFEVNMFMGDSPTSMEMYKITKPSIVRVPAGVWHCPLYYKKVVRGVNTIMWYVGESTGRVYPRVGADGKDEIYYEKDNWTHPCKKDPDKLCTYCGLCFNQTEEHIKDYMAPFFKNMASTTKYKDCIMELRADYHKLGDAVICPRAVFKGSSELKNADRQFSFNIVTKPCILGDAEPVSNGQVAEFLWFSGTDTVDPWGTFDAEIEVMLGESPDRMERVVFDKPGVVAIPPGTWRGTVSILRAGQPVCFIPFYPHTKDRYRITRKFVNGEEFLAYADETTIKAPNAGDELYLQMKR